MDANLLGVDPRLNTNTEVQLARSLPGTGASILRKVWWDKITFVGECSVLFPLDILNLIPGSNPIIKGLDACPTPFAPSENSFRALSVAVRSEVEALWVTPWETAIGNKLALSVTRGVSARFEGAGEKLGSHLQRPEPLVGTVQTWRVPWPVWFPRCSEPHLWSLCVNPWGEHFCAVALCLVSLYCPSPTPRDLSPLFHL